MNSSDISENEVADERRSKIWIAALGTGLLFWTSLFGLIFFCRRT